jgi:hypothetical protein
MTGKTIMIVDDDRELRPGGTTVIAPPHHQVDVAIILQRLAALRKGEQPTSGQLQQRGDAVDPIAILAALKKHRPDRLRRHCRAALAGPAPRPRRIARPRPFKRGGARLVAGRKQQDGEEEVTHQRRLSLRYRGGQTPRSKMAHPSFTTAVCQQLAAPAEQLSTPMCCIPHRSTGARRCNP